MPKASFMSIPTDEALKDPIQLRRAFALIIENLDVALGYRGNNPHVDAAEAAEAARQIVDNTADIVTITELITEGDVSSAANAERISDLENLELIAGTGLEGGGDLTEDRTFDMADTAVTPGIYGDATNSPQIVVDQQGRITSLANVSISAGSSAIHKFNGGNSADTPLYQLEGGDSSANLADRIYLADGGAS